MQKITPHLWFDQEAKEAALFYVSLFEDARLSGTAQLEDTPSGDAEVISFVLAGQNFQAISAGPYFKFNPALSFQVHCTSKQQVQALWDALSEGGTALMPLDAYPFNDYFGWIQDRFGLSWQLLLAPADKSQSIRPCLLFANERVGQAEAAIHFYTAVFPHSSIGLVKQYAETATKLPQAKINYAEFRLLGSDFVAMDHGFEADFSFNEAVSLMISCDTQAEIDYYWEKLSAVPQAEQCGWVKDQFGLSWQIVPTRLDEIMTEATPAEIKRVTEAFLQMKKFDIAALEKARLGE